MSNKNEKVVETTTTTLKDLESILKYCGVNKNSWSVSEYVLEQRAPTKEGKPQFNYKIYLKKKMDDEAIQSNFLASIKNNKLSWKNVKPRKIKEEYIYVLGIPDLHIGRMAWGKETGHEDYDSKIAYDCYVAAVKSLISHVENDPDFKRAGKILIPIGNDFFHTDNSDDTTTAGTKQDTDTRWQKMFLTGSKLVVDVIKNIGEKFPVDVVMVPGNHDHQRTFYLGEYLRAWFKDHPNVRINNEPAFRKYFSFGKNLLGFTHGNEEKQADLPLIMAQECAKVWSQAENKCWLIGHFHREVLKEFSGVKIYTLPSLCAPDAWHAKKGYVGNDRAAIAFLFGANTGLISNHYFKV